LAAAKAEEKSVPAPAGPSAAPVPPHPLSTTPPPISRNNSMGDPKSAGMRPKLKVRIPSEHSDAGSPSASPRDASGNAGNVSARPGNESVPVVLPPPSPSHSVGALLSAGATGPVNPFSRPLPTGSQPEQTPMSALPSRFTESMLPSPSTFYSDWIGGMSFGQRGASGGDNMLPSPLNFQTPVGANSAPFFKTEPEANNGKRRSPESDHSEGSAAKRPKNSR
jgi:MADS-box transcription factor